MPENLQDKDDFSTAVDLLRPYVELGKRLPLYFTLPSGVSVEGLCDRLSGATGSVPQDLALTIRYLAGKLGVPVPDIATYHTYSLVLRKIAFRLSLTYDQRCAPT